MTESSAHLAYSKALKSIQYYKKKVIWHLAIWQNWCFGQFYQSRIEVLQDWSASLMGGKNDKTREFLIQKIRSEIRNRHRNWNI
jgi:hypothetical protein